MVEAIYETLRRETQVMVCAQSNMAVDWIAQKLSERGVNILRIGNPMRVTDQMLADTYERRYEAHPLYSQLWPSGEPSASCMTRRRATVRTVIRR